jgi:hypothetical protein
VVFSSYFSTQHGSWSKDNNYFKGGFMMVRKILLLTLFALNAATLSASATDTVLYQLISQSEAEELEIEIPKNTPAGFKSLEVRVSGKGEEPIFKNILFCKNLEGAIHWDNICPDLTALNAQTALEAATTRDQLPAFDPLKDPKGTTKTAIIAFAALTVVMGASTFASKMALEKSDPNQPGFVASLSRGGVLASSTQLGRGDKSSLWGKPINQKMDAVVTKTGNRISGFTPLGTRILSDGNYQRSLLGPFSLVIYPIALALGIIASRSLHQEALPPSLFFILLMMAVGVMDALAGVFVSAAFVLSVLIGGHLNSVDSLLTVAGVSLLAFSPALLAGAFRPFRRPVWDFTSLWERITDYLLASILTGWVIQQIVLGLPGLSGLQLPITQHARVIALVAVGLVITRFAFEDISMQLFPQRLIKLEPNYRERTITQQLFATIFKVAIFSIVAGRYIGFTTELIIGILLFSLPLIMGIFEDKFPKSTAVQKWMPTGIIEMLVMTLGGYFLALAVQDRYPSARSYILVSFVLLSIPGFILKILALFGEEGAKDWKITKYGIIAYRVLGVVALGVLLYIILVLL